MAHLLHFDNFINIDPPLPPNSRVTASSSSRMLSFLGFNIPVIITSVPLDKNASSPKSVLVMAHFDTGASVTSIDEKIAKELELSPVGVTNMQTAAGLKSAKTYIADISFPHTALRGYRLNISDCNLPYNGNITDLSPQNFSVLLGRDIMTNWNIVWNGPSSTVFISD